MCEPAAEYVNGIEQLPLGAFMKQLAFETPSTKIVAASTLRLSATSALTVIVSAVVGEAGEWETETEGVSDGATMKVALIDFGEFIASAQSCPAVKPAQSPPHPVNVYPAGTIGWRIIVSPLLTDFVQGDGDEEVPQVNPPPYVESI